MSWTGVRIEFLKSRWAEGLTSTQIAAEMGITRNAVMGRIRRLNLARRVRNTPRKDPIPKGLLQKTIVPAIIIEQPKPEPVYADHEIPHEQRRSVLELNSQTCKWPIGDPRNSGFFFCGGKTAGNLPYCKQHSKAAFAVFDPNRKRAMFTLRHK